MESRIPRPRRVTTIPTINQQAAILFLERSPPCARLWPSSLQSMLMRWEVWDKYGPFNKTTPGRVCDSEDVEFCRKIHADGFKVGVVSPALIVNTGITNSFGQKIPGWELVKAQCPSGVLCE